MSLHFGKLSPIVQVEVHIDGLLLTQTNFIN